MSSPPELDVWEGSLMRDALARLPGCTVVCFDRAGAITDVPNAGSLRTEHELLGIDVATDLWATVPWTPAGDPEPVSLQWREPDTARTYAVDLVPLIGPDGALVGGIATARDVTAAATERLTQEQRLLEAQALFEGAFDAAPIAMAMVDTARERRGTLLRVNPAFAALMGMTPERLSGVHSLALMHPDDRAEAGAARPAAADQPIRTTPRLMRADGTLVWTEITTTLVRGPQGSVDYMLAVVVDTTARRSAEERRRASDERFRMMVESSSEGVCTLDAEDRLAFVNPKLAEMLAGDAGDLVGMPAGGLVPERFAAPLQAALDACRAGRQDRRELCLHRAGASELPVIVSTSPLTFPAGMYGGVLMMVTDISELVAAAQERDLQRSRLHDSQRLEAIGRLAGGIAHDFNNLLGVVINFAGFLEAELADRPTMLEDARIIRTAAERGADLTRQLLTFSRQDMAAPDVMDLRDVVRGAAELLRSVIMTNVDLTITVPTETCMVIADRHQFEHVLRSVAINACEAMPDGGELRLELAGAAADEDQGWITLSVHDGGVGMSAEVAGHAFEPFFTTKAEPGGGLGLASVYGIVTDHQGEIEIESARGEGTTVTIRIPEAQAGGPAPPPEPGSTDEGDLILLVDDDPVVRALATRQLTQAGFTVTACGDPAEALERPELVEGGVGLLLTDLMLPTMTGEQLARRVRELVPSVGVVFTSGYTDDELGREAVRDAGTVFVAKPFTGAELVEGVRRALAGRRSRP